MKISINLSSRHMVRFDLKRISHSLPAPVSVMGRVFGHTSPESGPSSTVYSLCCLMVFSSVRAMIAKEAHTSDSVKQLQAQGVDDDKWEQTYKGETGGVLTSAI